MVNSYFKSEKYLAKKKFRLNLKHSKSLIKFINKVVTSQDFKKHLTINSLGKIEIGEDNSSHMKIFENIGLLDFTEYNYFTILIVLAVLYYGKNANLNFIETKGVKSFENLFSGGQKWLELNPFIFKYLKRRSISKKHLEFRGFYIFDLEKRWKKEIEVGVTLSKFNGWFNDWTFETIEKTNHMFYWSEFNRHFINFNFEKTIYCSGMFAKSCYNHEINIDASIKKAYSMFNDAKITKNINLNLMKGADLTNCFNSIYIKTSQIKNIDFEKIINFSENIFDHDYKKFVFDHYHKNFINIISLIDCEEDNVIKGIKSMKENEVFNKLLIEEEIFFKNKSHVLYLLAKLNIFKEHFLTPYQIECVVDKSINKLLEYLKNAENNVVDQDFTDKYNERMIFLNECKKNCKNKVINSDEQEKSDPVFEKVFLRLVKIIEDDCDANIKPFDMEKISKDEANEFFKQCLPYFLQTPIFKIEKHKKAFIESFKEFCIELDLLKENSVSKDNRLLINKTSILV